MREKMLENLAKFQKEGSGWRLSSVEKLEIFITKFRPLAGKEYTTPLPKNLQGKKAIVNMKNNDNQCFKWAVTRALNPTEESPHRITKILKEQSKKFNWEETEFPLKVKNIGKWEKNNNININVFGYDEESKKLYTLKLGALENSAQTVKLFLHDDNHYCPITDLSRLVSMQLSKKKNKKYICLRCINAFGSEEILTEHKALCDNHELQRHVYPTEGRNWTNFKNYERMHYVTFVVNADFECFIESIDHTEGDPKKSFTVQYQKHKPSGFCHTSKCIDESISKTKTVLYIAKNADEDIGKKFGILGK